jgi:hypothetical protein
MRTIHDIIDIPASDAAVWRVLTATQHYGAWNPFIPRLQGELRTGGRLRLTIRPPGRSMTVTATVPAVEEDRLLRWRGRLGVLVPLVSGVLDDTRIGFAQMNKAMRQRAVTAPPRART